MRHDKAVSPREAFTAFDPQRQVNPDDPWYADIESFFDRDSYGIRDALLLRIIPDKFSEPYRSVGVVGHRGTGKTTLVRSAVAALEADHHFAPVVVDAVASLDLSDFTFADFIVTLVNAVVGALATANATMPEADLKLFRQWFTEELVSSTQTSALGGKLETSAEVTGGIPLFAKLMAKISAIVRTESQTRREIRQHIEREPLELVRRANLLFDAARKALGGKPLVIVVDNLEKINNRALVDAAILRRADEVRSLRASLIMFLDPADEYAPITVKASEAFPIVTLPMLPVRQAKHPYDHVDPKVTAALKELVGRRVVLGDVFDDPPAAIQRLALHSGGRLRDVIELARSACELAGSKKVTVANIHRAAEKASATRAVFRAGDLELLAAVARSKRIQNDTMHGYLLLHSLVLQYNGRPWWDIHPLLLLEDDIRKLVDAGSPLMRAEPA